MHEKNVVLGGESFKRLNQSSLNSLLNFALDEGVNTLDTAPTYGSSEELIGGSPSRFRFSINTKVGRPFSDVITRTEILKSVDCSLKLLRIEVIDCLYLHSVNIDNLNDSVIEALQGLIEIGKVRRLGYSGDGASLCKAINAFGFSDFMATFNLVDQGNLPIIKDNTNFNWSIKRPLANGVWNQTSRKRLLAFYQFLTNQEINWRSDIYFNRFKLLKSLEPEQISLRICIGYIQNLFPKARIVVGVRSQKQLSQILNAEPLSKYDFERMKTAYAKLGELIDLQIRT